MQKRNTSEAEYDFSLVIAGVLELNQRVEDALFEAGCDDATLSIRGGRLYMMFSRMAACYWDALVSAIADVEKANVGADVVRVDSCNLVTQSDIARRIGRSRQLVHQYMSGERGPGQFPSPICHLHDKHPLWQWCEVASWLWENDFIRGEILEAARYEMIINNLLELRRYGMLTPEETKDMLKSVPEVATSS